MILDFTGTQRRFGIVLCQRGLGRCEEDDGKSEQLLQGNLGGNHLNTNLTDVEAYSRKARMSVPGQRSVRLGNVAGCPKVDIALDHLNHLVSHNPPQRTRVVPNAWWEHQAQTRSFKDATSLSVG